MMAAVRSLIPAEMITRMRDLLPHLEEELQEIGEAGFALFQQQLAAGQFTGVLAVLQPEFAAIKGIVDFLSFARSLTNRLAGIKPPSNDGSMDDKKTDESTGGQLSQDQAGNSNQTNPPNLSNNANAANQVQSWIGKKS